MNVEKIVLRQIAIPLKSPFRSSAGREMLRRVIIVEAHMDDLIGYGEASPLSAPYYTEETPGTVWHVLSEFLVPLVLQNRHTDVHQVTHTLQSVKRHFMAKAGLEGAMWDLWCKAQNIPLYKALGGVTDRVPSGISVGLTDQVDDLIKTVKKALNVRYHKIKIKIEPGRDIELIRELRTRLGDFPLMADANSAYTVSDTMHLRRLDDFGLLMIEQPFERDDYVDHATLQKSIRTPVCLDEGIESLCEARQAVALNSCRIINIKPGRVGGLTEAKRIHDFCFDLGLPVWCGGLLESDIGRAHNAALASLPGFTVPGDMSPTDRYFTEQLVSPTFALDHEGYIQVPSGPGIGVEVNLDLLSHLTEKSLTIP